MTPVALSDSLLKIFTNFEELVTSPLLSSKKMYSDVIIKFPVDFVLDSISPVIYWRYPKQADMKRSFICEHFLYLHDERVYFQGHVSSVGIIGFESILDRPSLFID